MKFTAARWTVWLTLAAAPVVQAQHESGFGMAGRGGVGVTFATDYQAIGVNPANMARTNAPKFAFSLGEFGAGVGSQSVSASTIKLFLKASEQALTLTDKQQLARDFTSPQAFNLNVEAVSVGLAVQLKPIGTVAFSNRQRLVSHVGLSKNTAEILFLGQEAPIFQNYDPATAPLLSEALAGTRVQTAWYNEYNGAFAREIISTTSLHVSLGVGYRYIQGIGAVDFRVVDGQVQAYSALSPLFGVDYGKVATQPGFNLEERLNGLQPVGKGHGFDAGVSVDAGKKLRLALAVTDVGSITWKGNLLKAQDQRLRKLDSDGVDNYDFFSEAARLFAAGTDSLVVYEAAPALREQLPTRLRAGVGLLFSGNLEVGLEVATPLNKVAGSLPNTFVGAAVDYKPWSWLRLSSGLTGGSGYGFGLPLGISLTTPIYEAGVGTRDVTGFFSAKNPYGSLGAAFLRFRVGRQQ